MATPKVTVCIPSYNYAGYLPQAIESVLAQTYEDFELLIIDDCSSDNTDEVVADYCSKDRRVVYEVNDRNLGMVENWNRCLFKARGLYVKFLLADDFLYSADAIRLMVDCLDSAPEISLVASARHLADGDSRIIKTRCHYEESQVVPGADLISHCLFKQRNLIGEPSVIMFRKAQAQRGFHQGYRQLVDLEMWFHLLEQGGLAYLSQPLCVFRVHGLQQTAKNKGSSVTFDELGLLFEDFLDNRYVKINSVARSYMRYEHCYKLWRLYAKGVISRELAVDKIRSSYGFRKFRLLYPFYRMLKPFFKALEFVDTRWYTRLPKRTERGKL